MLSVRYPKRKRVLAAAVLAGLILVLSGCSVLDILMPRSDSELTASPSESPSPTETASESQSPKPTTTPVIPSPPVTLPSNPLPSETITPVTPNPSPDVSQNIDWEQLILADKFKMLDIKCDDERASKSILGEAKFGEEKSTRRFLSRMRTLIPKDMIVSDLILDDGFINFIAASNSDNNNSVSVDAYKFQWSVSAYEGALTIQCYFEDPDYNSTISLFCKTAIGLGYELDMYGVKALADELYLGVNIPNGYSESKFSSSSSDVTLQVRAVEVSPGKMGVMFIISDSVQSEGGDIHE